MSYVADPQYNLPSPLGIQRLAGESCSDLCSYNRNAHQTHKVSWHNYLQPGNNLTSTLHNHYFQTLSDKF
jgi:hypothetical protein